MDKRSLLFVCILTASFLFINTYFFTPKVAPQKQPIVKVEEKEPITKIAYNASSSEGYYVLENDTLQVVFSTAGGAISEINLPFQTKENQSSVVKPILFDRQIEKSYPANAVFPLESASIADSNGKIVKKEPTRGGYTPLLRRSLKNEQGETSFAMPSKFYAMNLVSGDAGQDQTVYQVTRFAKNEIQLVGKHPQAKVTKTFRLNDKAPYSLDLDVKVEGNTSGLWLTSGIPEVELVTGSYSPIIEYYTLQGRKGKVEKIKLPKEQVTYSSILPSWVANTNGFFGIITDPVKVSAPGLKADQIPGASIPTRLSIIDAAYNLYPSKNYPAYETFLPYKPTSETVSYRIFVGPFDGKILAMVDEAYADPASGTTPNFTTAITFQGWFSFISEPFAKFLFLILNLLHEVTRSWGFSIILLTLILRLILYPLNSWSYKSNLKMQKLAPKLKALQEKFKKDPKRMQMETAMLYKNEKVNPFSGCLPILIQLPFLIGMFDLLKSTFALRGASFIPGWIDNLSAPDVLFSWSYPVIFIGTSFHLLPFVNGALMYVQQKITAGGQDKNAPLTDQQQQMKSMASIMTIFFTFIFYNMPSGLNIYWIFSTLFGMLQQWLIMKRNAETEKKPQVLK